MVLSRKILSALMFSVVIIPAIVNAAPPDEMGMGPGKMLDRMATRLHLTDDQKSKMQEIMQEEMSKQKALHEEMHQKMAAVLTPEQQAQMKKMMSEGRQKMRERMKDCMGTPGGEEDSGPDNK